MNKNKFDNVSVYRNKVCDSTLKKAIVLYYYICNKENFDILKDDCCGMCFSIANNICKVLGVDFELFLGTLIEIDNNALCHLDAFVA